MYLPGHFAETGAERLHALMRANPLATVVSGGGGLEANHLPLLLEASAPGSTVLHSHVARGNPLALMREVPVLAVFHGPDAYVSPSWYPSKKDDGRVVPTWNYAVVHAHGRLRAIDDGAWICRHIEALTNLHEAGMASPWQVDDAPADFIARLTGAIVGIEIVVERLEGKFKLSQNRSAADRQGVVAGLRGPATGKAGLLAQLMADSTGQAGLACGRK